MQYSSQLKQIGNNRVQNISTVKKRNVQYTVKDGAVKKHNKTNKTNK